MDLFLFATVWQWQSTPLLEPQEELHACKSDVVVSFKFLILVGLEDTCPIETTKIWLQLAHLPFDKCLFFPVLQPFHCAIAILDHL